MKKITINACNWTGKNITFKLYKNNIFKLYDYKFKMEIKETKYNFDGKEEIFLHYKVFQLNYKNEKSDFPFVVGCVFENDKYVTMFDGEIKEGNLNRSDICPFKAAVKVLANTI